MFQLHSCFFSTILQFLWLFVANKVIEVVKCTFTPSNYLLSILVTTQNPLQQEKLRNLDSNLNHSFYLLELYQELSLILFINKTIIGLVYDILLSTYPRYSLDYPRHFLAFIQSKHTKHCSYDYCRRVSVQVMVSHHHLIFCCEILSFESR